MSAPTTAAAVANAFLDIQAEDRTAFPPIDPLKLQKLLFYSQPWWLAHHDGAPLFDEEIYAWPWGPVVPSLYSEFRDFGAKSIFGKQAMEMTKVGNGPLDFRFMTPRPNTDEVKGFLQSIWHWSAP